MRVGQSGNNNQVQDADAAAAKKTGKAGHAKSAKESEKAGIAASTEAADGAKAELSAKGKEFARAKAIAGGTPDVREAKIAALKQRIASGSYNVDTDAIADRMVDEHLHTSTG